MAHLFHISSFPYFGGLVSAQFWVHSLFLTEGGLRPFWRFMISVLAARAVFVGSPRIISALRQLFGLDLGHPGAGLAAYLLGLALLLGIFGLFTILLDDRPLGSMGFYFHPRWRIELGLGLALGFILIAGQAGLLAVAGFADFHTSSVSVEHLIYSGLFFLALFAVAAAFEELAFRGYPFRSLIDSVGPVGGVLILAILFSLAHMSNPHQTWLSTLNTFLAGVAFCLAYLQTRALWLPTGLHFSWNFFQGYGFGFPVSGIGGFKPVLQVQLEGATYWTGGAYGLEGSLITTLFLLLLMVYLKTNRTLFVTAKMRFLLDRSFRAHQIRDQIREPKWGEEKGKRCGL